MLKTKTSVKSTHVLNDANSDTGGNGVIPLYVLYSAAILDVVLSILCVFCYVSRSQQAFGLALLLQTIGVIITLKLLEASELMNFIMSLSIAGLAVYLLMRLYYSEMIPFHHALFTIALHITTALTNLPQSSSASSQTTSGTAAWAIIEFIVLFMLEVAICRIMVFQRHVQVISKRDYVKSVGETGLLAMLNAPLWLSRLLTLVTRAEPGLADYLSTILVLEAIIASHIVLLSHCDWANAKYVPPCLGVSAVLISVVGPEVTFTWENMLKWMLLVSLFTCIVITRLVTYLRKSLLLLVAMAAIAGFPLGFSISALVFSKAFTTVHIVNSVLATTLFVVTILVWLESANMEQRVIKTVVSLTASLVVAMCGVYVVMETRVVAMQLILCSSLFSAALVLSIVFKIHSLRRQSLQFTKEGLIRISKLPLLGNISTLVAMATFWFVSPWQQDYTVYLSTCVLIFLQRDHVILKSHSKQNNLTPTIATVYLFLTITTAKHSSVWLATDWWPWLLGCIEVYICIATLPVLYILSTVLWNERFYMSDRCVVFLAPLYSVLILVGTSYTSWLLGTVGMLVGWWLMSYKLPLDR